MSASVAFDGGEPRQPARQRRDQPGQLRTVRVDMGDELLFGGVGDVVAERLGEELVRRGEILFAMPEQHARPAVERSPGRLGDQRGLAQTGLTRDEEHLAALATGDALERVRHRRHLGFPADDTRRGTHAQTARQRHGIRRRPRRAAPSAPRRSPPDRAGPSTSSGPTRMHSCRLRRPAINRTTSAARIWPPSQRRAESGGLDHRVAEVVVVLAA